jgi:predicted dithiol-disulfide oxidoreductase (DUF899 family)
MSLPDVVSRDEWLAARKQLLEQEKKFTRERDALNSDRRRLPMVRLEQEYVFQGPDGPVTLAELFGGKRQLIVQHVMYGPDWQNMCPGCNASINIMTPALFDHMASRDTNFVLISRAPYEKIAAMAAERGWSVPWYSSYGTDFNYDFGVTADTARGPVEYNYRPEPDLFGADGGSTELPGYSCFLREGQDVFHTYSAYGRGTEGTVAAYHLLDMTALGRQEDWEEPKGRVEAVRGGDPTFTS